MRLRAIALAGLLLMTLAVLAAGAGAAGKPTKAACTLKTPVSLSPGISRTPSSGTFSGTGTISCRGLVAGATANGTGGLTISGSYGPTDTCNTGKGSGTFSASVPTNKGTKNVTGSFTFTRVGAAGTFKGTTSDGAGNTAGINGAFTFVPASGQTCVTKTVTNATVNGAAALNG